MKKLAVSRLIGMMAVVGLLTGQLPVAAFTVQAVAAAPSVPVISQPVVQPIPGVDTQPAKVQQPVAPFEETKAERKARLKAEKAVEKARKRAERAERKRIQAEERARKRAERKARGGNDTGKAILGCAAGAVGGLLIGGLLGAKKKQLLGAAVAGCGLGLAFSQLSKKDNEKLNNYVQDDFLVQDESCNRTWYAAESKKNVQVACGQTSYQNQKHAFYMEDDVQFDGSNISVVESVKYSTTSLRLRSSPNTSSAANIIGGYARGDKILTYGKTNDGKWTYIVDKLPDGSYELLGYAASAYLADKAPSKAARTTRYAKMQPTKSTTNRAAAQRYKSASNARPQKRVTANANTRCKTVNVSVGQESKSTSSCGGASLAMIPGNRKQGRKA